MANPMKIAPVGRDIYFELNKLNKPSLQTYKTELFIKLNYDKW